MPYLNFKEFYPNAIIPISDDDRTVVEGLSNASTLTHWLIAIEGHPKNPSSEKYVWKISIYPSNSSGSYYVMQPYYTSSPFDTVSKAIEKAKELKWLGIRNQLFLNGLLDKTS